MTRTITPLLMVSALGLGGCATLRPHPGFTDVEKLVAERTAAKVEWRDGGPADAEVAERIKATLAKELTSDAAVQVALFNNRKLQVVYQSLGIAEADLVQAGLLPNPVLNADVRFGGPHLFTTARQQVVIGLGGVTSEEHVASVVNGGHGYARLAQERV